MHPFHSTCMSIHWIKRMISVGEQRNATTRKLRTATDNRIKGPKGRPAPMRSAAARRAARILTTARRGRSSRALTPPGPSPPPPLPRSQQRNSPPFIRFGGEAASLWRGRRIVSRAGGPRWFVRCEAISGLDVFFLSLAVAGVPRGGIVQIACAVGRGPGHCGRSL